MKIIPFLMTQNEAVIQTLEKLEGVATLGILYQEVFKIKECKWATKTPAASVRRIVQLHPEIYKIKPGLYGLKKYQKQIESRGILVETDKNKNSKELMEFNHSYYQGLILLIGSLKKFETFVPQQDKNRMFIHTPLGELRTLNSIPQFSYTKLVQRSSSIDVIWFNERNMPNSFFEVEHSTDIQNSLLKYNDLQDFNTRMVIVADKNRKDEFHNKIKYSSFMEIRNRVQFADYDSLTKQYESLLDQQRFEVLF